MAYSPHEARAIASRVIFKRENNSPIWYSGVGQLSGKSYVTPAQPGDIFLQSGFCHTALVRGVSGSTVYTVEGNLSSTIMNYSRQYGGNRYYRPDYAYLVQQGIFSSVNEAVAEVLAVAEEQRLALGGTKISNNNKYSQSIRGCACAWCACFVHWCIAEAIKRGKNKNTKSTFPVTKITSTTAYPKLSTPIDGVDLSGWDATAPQEWFNKIKNKGYKFIIHRVGVSSSKNYKPTVDKQVVEHYARARKAGLDVGFYYYTKATNADFARQEARFAIEIMKKAVAKTGEKLSDIKYPCFIDVEEEGLYKNGKNKQGATNAVLAFQDVIQNEAGLKCGIYCSTSHYQDMVYDNQLSGIDHWVAHWSNKCTYSGSYNMWQYINDTYLEGWKVDKNKCYVDYNSIPNPSLLINNTVAATVTTIAKMTIDGVLTKEELVNYIIKDNNANESTRSILQSASNNKSVPNSVLWLGEGDKIHYNDIKLLPYMEKYFETDVDGLSQKSNNLEVIKAFKSFLALKYNKNYATLDETNSYYDKYLVAIIRRLNQEYIVLPNMDIIGCKAIEEAIEKEKDFHKKILLYNSVPESNRWRLKKYDFLSIKDNEDNIFIKNDNNTKKTLQEQVLYTAMFSRPDLIYSNYFDDYSFFEEQYFTTFGIDEGDDRILENLPLYNKDHTNTRLSLGTGRLHPRTLKLMDQYCRYLSYSYPDIFVTEHIEQTRERQKIYVNQPLSSNNAILLSRVEKIYNYCHDNEDIDNEESIFSYSGLDTSSTENRILNKKFFEWLYGDSINEEYDGHNTYINQIEIDKVVQKYIDQINSDLSDEENPIQNRIEILKQQLSLKKESLENKMNSDCGMLIDLSKGEIRFGNENFSIDSSGFLVTKKAKIYEGYFEGELEASFGKIGGWSLMDNAISNYAAIVSQYYNKNNNILDPTITVLKTGSSLTDWSIVAGSPLDLVESDEVITSSEELIKKQTLIKIAKKEQWDENCFNEKSSLLIRQRDEEAPFRVRNDGKAIGLGGFYVFSGLEDTNSCKIYVSQDRDDPIMPPGQVTLTIDSNTFSKLTSTGQIVSYNKPYIKMVNQYDPNYPQNTRSILEVGKYGGARLVFGRAWDQNEQGNMPNYCTMIGTFRVPRDIGKLVTNYNSFIINRDGVNYTIDTYYKKYLKNS